MIRRSSLILLALTVHAIAPNQTCADWHAMGLSGRHVNRLRLQDGLLFACTSSGLFRLSFADPDTLWTPVGLTGQNVLDLASPGSGVLLAARALSGAADDTTSIYRSIDGGASWQPFQNGFGAGSGISGHQAKRILPLAGPPGVLLGMSGRIEKSIDGGLSWKAVSPSAVLNAIAQSPANSRIVWAGGENLIFAPYVFKSVDAGDTWREYTFFAGGDNAVDAIGCHPTDSNAVYLGMEGRVMKTEDGGSSWWNMTSPNPSMYTFGMAIRPTLPLKIFAAGASFVPDPRGVVFHQSLNGALSWRAVSYPAYAGQGVYDLLLVSGAGGEAVYLATDNGVFVHSEIPSAAPTPEAQERVPLSCRPNPFFRNTSFEFTLPKEEFVSLRVLDVQGRAVALLTQGVRRAGPHRVVWKAEDLPSGIYFTRFQSDAGVHATKILLLR